MLFFSENRQSRQNFCIKYRMIRLKTPALFLLIIFILQSCDGFKFPTTLFETSERAKYERQFSGSDSLLTHWKNDFSSASTNELQIEDGFSMIVPSGNKNFSAMGYSIDLKKGDRLVIETSNSKNLKNKIFVDIFKNEFPENTSKTEIIKNGKLSTFIEKDGRYKIVIQPEIENAESFPLKIFTQSSLEFPVAGKGNRDAQSFWGAVRDGGDRSHEGVDIFASRGTPAIAATNGYVTRTGDQGLGGKQVWLRDGIFGNSLYYAHLDSIMTESGKQVKVGDTLGLVGNTGNAKGGATHLHFGIYSADGAVDAYPFIKIREVPQDLKIVLKNFQFLKADSNLRKGPGSKYEVLQSIPEEFPVTVLNGNGEWFHIKTKNGKEGFVNRERLK